MFIRLNLQAKCRFRNNIDSIFLKLQSYISSSRKKEGGNKMFNVPKVDGKKSILAFLFSVLLAEGVGVLTRFLGMSKPENYKNFIMPPFSPSAWIFTIVWSILYLLMAAAAYRIWVKGRNGEDVTKTLVVYFIQLFLNFLWTIIFFRLRLIGLAFIELLLLLIFIMLTTFEFFRIDKISGLLMLPYILWVSFAEVLNYTIWMLNNM